MSYDHHGDRLIQKNDYNRRGREMRHENNLNDKITTELIRFSPCCNQYIERFEYY